MINKSSSFGISLLARMSTLFSVSRPMALVCWLFVQCANQ